MRTVSEREHILKEGIESPTTNTGWPAKCKQCGMLFVTAPNSAYLLLITLCQASTALGLFSRSRAITLTASASDRARLDRPESSSFSFTSVFSVKASKNEKLSLKGLTNILGLKTHAFTSYPYQSRFSASCQTLWMVRHRYGLSGG